MLPMDVLLLYLHWLHNIKLSVYKPLIFLQGLLENLFRAFSTITHTELIVLDTLDCHALQITCGPCFP